MSEFGTIYLSWRKGFGHRRHIVGKIKSNVKDGVRFQYIKDNVKTAEKEGFEPYTEFPDLEKEYKDNVLEVFGQRIIRSERADIKDFLSFWEIDEKHKDNKLYMLAHTQGLSTSDNFEFLADFNPIKKLKFTTELAGLSKIKLAPDSLAKGDFLTFKLAPNEYDEDGVEVYKKGFQVGYIKRIHSKVFHKTKRPIELIVKSTEKNGIIKRVFLCVSIG